MSVVLNLFGTRGQFCGRQFFHGLGMWGDVSGMILTRSEQPRSLYVWFTVGFELLQFHSVQSLSRVQLFATPWTAARQASLFITNSQSLLKLMSIKSVMPSNHLILCHPLLLLPSIFTSIRVFFKWVSSLHQATKVFEFQLQHQPFQWIFRTDFL